MKPNSRIPSKYRHFIEQNAWMIGGNILFAIGVNMIVTPLGLYNGGFMGMAQLLRLLCVNVLHIPVPAGFDLVGVIYFLMTFILSKVFGHFEKKMQKADRHSGYERKRKQQREVHV